MTPRSSLRLAAVLLALVPAVAACAAGPEEAGPAPSGSSSASSAAVPGVAEAARVGAADSGCALPVSFGIAASWTPKAVDLSGLDAETAAALGKGGMVPACEIDAKPAGNIGFIRVYTGEHGDLRATLTSFAGADAQAPAFTELQIGGVPAAEITYTSKSALDGTVEQEAAFAVDTPKGVVVVALDSFDDEEHAAMLPAYELAKSSLTVN
ncbi:hypothetical protein J2S43_003319 [Catenuloplanes nepalensis]|uniref:Lipoprotein n=1 Tax=Catenuloplanes nepalensis TaxID=587533 RepID=A0ABT9MTP7_9ACTN|nr:lipoprotein [Catenuloplanes nepalensis]MDP9794807.1 hypothetical protein [Catenuloplanes nepalensis]